MLMMLTLLCNMRYLENLFTVNNTTMSIKSDERLEKVYKYRNYSSDSQRKKLLDILLATANDRQIKIALEELNIK